MIRHSWETESRLDSRIRSSERIEQMPDYTASMKLRLGTDGYYYIMHAVRDRLRPDGVKRMMLKYAELDGRTCTVGIPLDAGGAGKAVFEDHAKNLSGFVYKKCKTNKSKLERFLPFSSAAEAGLIKIVKGKWNDDFIRELENFVGDGKGHDDWCDTASDSFNNLATTKPLPSSLSWNPSLGSQSNVWE